MPNYKEDRPNSSPFQNGTDQQDRLASHDGGPPHIPHDQLVTHFRSFIAQDQEREEETQPRHFTNGHYPLEITLGIRTST